MTSSPQREMDPSQHDRTGKQQQEEGRQSRRSSHPLSRLPPTFLSLPPEIRVKIYNHLFNPAGDLTVRSLFIREHYRNVFMIQQQQHQPYTSLGASILRVNRLIASETLPILYSLPRWACGCRVEALACQIGKANLARIKWMEVDVDDLDVLVEGLQRRRQRWVHRWSGGGGGGKEKRVEYAMQSVPVPMSVRRALKVDDDDYEYEDGRNGSGTRSRARSGNGMSLTGTRTSSSSSQSSMSSLDFGNLEILEVEGYQSAALSGQGTHRVRIEALRLCELAMQLLDFHPKLKYLLQKNSNSDGIVGGVGGADARDLTLGRVRWRFVKDLPLGFAGVMDERADDDINDGIVMDSTTATTTADAAVTSADRAANTITTTTRIFRGISYSEVQVDGEHMVDLALIRSNIELGLKDDENRVETSLPVAWTSSASGRFHLSPYLQAAGG